MRMNVAKKAYCRAFQGVFKAAIPVLPYRDPKRLEGVEAVPPMLKKRKKSHPLIVTDKSIHGLGLIDPLKQSLEQAGLEYDVFDDVVPNPTIENVEAARALYESKGCDCLIAFGGGSSLDCAKACGARLVKPNQSIPKMRGILKIHKKLPLLIAVPTTAGTGSETTVAAVITDGETHYKYPINDFCLIPQYAVLDYHTTTGLPKHITSTTGMDALVHATEAYIGRSTTKETRACAIEAVQIIRQYLKVAYDEPENAEARQKMLYASNRAGLAFSKSYVGYVHGVAHSLGGQYGTPHGLANAVICPYVLEMYGEACHKRLADLARKGGVVEEGLSDAETAERYIAWFREMNEYMNIPTKIEGIRVEDIPGMARKADAESNPLYPVPVLWNAKELERIYYAVMA